MKDEFQLGQWLKGRIYERRCDLSPDGKHFLYIAMNGKWQTEARGSWTAISRAPYLKALAIFPKGDCWHGGGLWTGARQYWLNDGYGPTVLRDRTVFAAVRALAPDHYQRELRLFAVACARRIWTLLPDACRESLNASGQLGATPLRGQKARHDCRGGLARMNT